MPNHPATPIATAVAARINRDENDAHWANDLGSGHLNAAHVRNRIAHNTTLADELIMEQRAWRAYIKARANESRAIAPVQS